MSSKSPTRLAAEKLCRTMPDAPSRTLAKKLSASHNVTIEQARSMIRTSRGNIGERLRSRATQDCVRPNQPAGWKPEMPPSLAEPWLPFELGNGIRVAILSDIHIPYHSTIAFESAVNYCKKRRPDVLLLNGDFADFYSISRHQKDPSKRDFKEEMKLCQEGLMWLRQVFGKRCRFVFKAGNHEERLTHFLWNAAPEICDSPRMTLKEWLSTDEDTHKPIAGEIEFIQDQRPIMLGKLPVQHGHELPHGANPVSAARGAFMRTISTLLIGHGHRSSHHSEPNMWHIETSCWSTGCLCDLNPEYARTNKWNFGFAFVDVADDGEFHVDNLRMSLEGKVW